MPGHRSTVAKSHYPASPQLHRQREHRLDRVAILVDVCAALDEKGRTLVAGACWVVDRGRGRACSVRLREPGSEPMVPSLVLPPGDYELLVTVETAAGGRYGRSRLRHDASSTQPHVVTLEEGRVVEGILRRADGGPIAEQTLRWTLEGWPALGPRGGPVSTVTDRDGRFRVTCVPKGVALVGEHAGEQLPSGHSSESSVIVELR